VSIQETKIGITRILDQWDPIGLFFNQQEINYEIDGLGEYSSYIKPIVETFLNKESLINCLILINNRMYEETNSNQLVDIQYVAKNLFEYLTKCDQKFLNEIIL
jgi:hypothetical protein